MDGRFDSARSGGNHPELAIASHAYRKKLLYDPIDDFIPISLIDKGACLLAVHRTVPATSVREPIDLLDRRVITASFGSTFVARFQENDMDLQLNGKTALVTGASMGIGHAIARGLAAEGVRVCVVARRRNLLDELADQIASKGHPRPEVIESDLMEEGAPERVANAAAKALGRVDILMNSAGGSQPAIGIDAGEAAWEESMRLNFVRLRQLTHAVLPGMIENGWGRVVNITGKSEPEALITANAAKAAIHAWAKGLSRVIGPKGITINCIAPGRIMSEQIRRKYSPEFRAKQSAEEIPMGRYGEPEELAVVAVFLASPAAGYVTGTVIPVDGGLRKYAF